MNIALINQWYPPESYGGVAKYNYYMVNAYRKLGHNVFVISGLAKGAKKYKCENGVHIYRIEQIVIPWVFRKVPFLGSTFRFSRDLIYSFSVRKKLLELDKKFKIDTVEYAEINSEGFAHSLLGPKAIPFIVRCHTPYRILKKYYTKQERTFDSPLIYRMERFFIRKAVCLTAPSADLADSISQVFNVDRKKINVIANVIDIDVFCVKTVSRDDANIIKILYVGRIERAKGIFVFAEAFIGLARICKGKIRCIVVGADRSASGKDSARKEVQDYFSSREFLGDVEFRGKVSEEELIDIYNECDIFVNPSLIYESFSYTCLEAMACGTPVIASRIGGIPEVVVNGEGGFVFEPGDVNELVSKLEILIKDPAKRKEMGKKSRERAQTQFNALPVAEKNLEIYKKLQKKA